MAVYMHIQRGRKGYLKTWGHKNELQLLSNPWFWQKTVVRTFLVFCHISYITMDRLKPIIIICIYISAKLYTNFISFLFSCGKKSNSSETYRKIAAQSEEN